MCSMGKASSTPDNWTGLFDMFRHATPDKWTGLFDMFECPREFGMLGMRSGGHREGRLDSGIFDATGGERTGEGGWRGARWGVSGTERGWLTRRSEGLVGIGWYVFNGKGLFDTGQLDRPLRHVPTCDTGQMDRPLRHVPMGQASSTPDNWTGLFDMFWRGGGGLAGGWEDGRRGWPVSRCPRAVLT